MKIRIKGTLLTLTGVLLSACVSNAPDLAIETQSASGLVSTVNQEQSGYSIETGLTIQKVRAAQGADKRYIVAASYEGTVLGVDYDGKTRWKNPLSGFMVHDLWNSDLNGDGIDEILVANADGAIYCLNSDGQLIWKQQQNEVPMNTVTSVKKEGKIYVVAGGFDLNIYYLNATNGQMIKKIPSSSYSVQKPWNWAGKSYLPPAKRHYANFLRPAQKTDGSQVLILHGNDNSMQNFGYLYLFDVLANQPFKNIEIENIKGVIRNPIGDMRVVDENRNGKLEVILGYSSHLSHARFARYEIDLNKPQAKKEWKSQAIKGLGFGYSVTQTELIKDAGEEKYLTRVGRTLQLNSVDLNDHKNERYHSKYSYYDFQIDANKVILASAQSGGSGIHILNMDKPGWKKAYTQLKPSSKIKTILANTDKVRQEIEHFTPPDWQRAPRPVYFMTETLNSPVAKKVSSRITQEYRSPIFLNGKWMQHVENWDRSDMPNEKYKKKRDKRKKYDWSQQQVLDFLKPLYKNKEGIAYWVGHGNDPYMFQLDTTKKVLDMAAGKKTVLILPELEDHGKNMEFVMGDFIYPLADHAKKRNGNLFIRTKHNFWHGNIYLPMWEKVLDGDYANAIVPAMEETTDKAMDISIAGRVGLWASGVFDNWGTRSINDNASFDRSRQFSNQRLPNHFLRQQIYHMAQGANYINNLATDNEYISVVWDLLAKGALYVPKTNEVLSYSPVHLGMKEPDEHYMNESSSLKWSTFYDKGFEENNPFVFSRNSATYMAAKNTEWDFSSYASQTKDRRQNFLPSYPNGLVLITPPQQGVFAKAGVTRGSLTDHLHPLYKNIMQEYITDGRHYYSADGTKKYAADTYYKKISDDIQQLSQKLPIKVEGDVAWVVAQTAPNHLRLTIIDGGYLNPSDKQAKVVIQTADVKQMTDIIDQTTFNLSNPKEVKVDIPLGLFRFIDIELNKPL